MTRPGFFEHLHPATIPAREARWRYTFGLGGAGLYLFVVLAATGIPLMFAYVPTQAGAADSIRAITFVAPYGWFLRNLHYWAGQLLLIVATLHLVRVVFTGAYKRPRRLNWLLGVGLLALLLLLNFTGYVLRWDADTNWALTVGIHLVRETPLLGPWLFELLVGVPSSGAAVVGDITVVRFYTWHVVGLAIPVAGLIGWHVFKVRRDGGISRASSPDEPRSVRIHRSQLVHREAVAMLAVSVILFLLALLFDAPLGAAVDPMAGYEAAQAPWFFLWVQALLRILPARLAGVAAPLVIVLLLALLPWLLDRRDEGVGQWFHWAGRRAQITVLSLLVLLTLLTVWEMLR